MGINVSKISTSNLISECHSKLNKIGEITFENVKNADIETCSFLNKNSPVRLKELAQMNCYAAETLKGELDRRYGDGNYVIISLGRSISSICELIKQMGTSVVHFPLSGLRRNDFSQINDSELIMIKEYCETVGLTKEHIKKNQDKKYILMDYTYYGRTLDKTYNFLKRNDMLGDFQNFIKFSIGDVLGDNYTQTGLEKLLEFSRLKYYSTVGKLPIGKISKIFIQSNPETAREYRGNVNKIMRKLFWFNVFDSMIKKDYKNIFPRKEFDAIYNHFLNINAVRSRIKKLYSVTK